MVQPTKNSNSQHHRGPNLGAVAIVYMLLFNIGLYHVTVFSGAPYFPGPWESTDVIANFFQVRSMSAMLCAFFQFGSVIPLGIFTATIVSRLKFLGIRAAGPNIALFGGLATCFNMLASAVVLWSMTDSDVIGSPAVIQAMYNLCYAFGGPGFSVPMGILLAGISVSAGFAGLLPKWLVVSGLALALAGELSWLNLIFPQVIFLIPITRFPAFIWLILVGFRLPKIKEAGKH
jgi:hypothetical protein